MARSTGDGSRRAVAPCGGAVWWRRVVAPCQGAVRRRPGVPRMSGARTAARGLRRLASGFPGFRSRKQKKRAVPEHTITGVPEYDPQKGVRRCPTLPHPPECSTIGAVSLSFRVRNVTGRFPDAIAAVTLSTYQPHPPQKRVRAWPSVGNHKVDAKHRY